MVSPGYTKERQDDPSDGEWWVLLVTDGLTVEFPPELYRSHDDAEREAERWARLLARRAGARIQKPFTDRWEVGDEWVRLVPSFLAEQSDEIWVGTYWGRDGVPDPEAELFPDGNDAKSWVSEQPAGSILLESTETAWSAAARYRVRGGEAEAEAHRAKTVVTVAAPSANNAIWSTIYGFVVSEGLIPQTPDLFASETTRDRALRYVMEHELTNREWQQFVAATAEANYAETELPPAWRETWDPSVALTWLVRFDFITDGDAFEARRFETSVDA